MKKNGSHRKMGWIVDTFLDSPGTVEVTPEVPKTQVHLNYLDGLRALSALYVVLFHAAIFQAFPTGWKLRFTAWLLYGHFAVDVFIVISGFSLMLPVVRGNGSLRGGYWGFMRRRAKRILPPYYFALFFATILATTIIRQKSGTGWDICLPVTLTSVVTHLLLIHNAFIQYISSINGPFWSIAVEWQLYFLFPLLVLCWSRLGGVKTTIFAAFIAYLGEIPLRHSTMRGITPHYLALFSFGMLGAAASFSQQKTWQRLRTPSIWGICFAVSLAAVAFICHHFGDYLVLRTHGALADFFVGALTLCFLVLVSLPGKNLFQLVLSWRPLRFVGKFAYSLYLVHFPLQELLWKYVLLPLHLNPKILFLSMMLGSAVFCPGFAYLFFLCCEKPFFSTRPSALVKQEPVVAKETVIAG